MDSVHVIIHFCRRLFCVYSTILSMLFSTLGCVMRRGALKCFSNMLMEANCSIISVKFDALCLIRHSGNLNQFSSLIRHHLVFFSFIKFLCFFLKYNFRFSYFMCTSISSYSCTFLNNIQWYDIKFAICIILCFYFEKRTAACQVERRRDFSDRSLLAWSIFTQWVLYIVILNRKISYLWKMV